ncbi:hypothetical protein JXA85_05210 [Candidatus Woesearchaeota archaeon]|nr:hypothetical protein [Candidatus Woesearchaeota archaeon]
MILLLRCPRCRNQMKYQTTEQFLTGKRKSCVYCGRSFKVNDAMIKRIK